MSLYKVVRKNLSPKQCAGIFLLKMESDDFKINERSHVIIKCIGREIGYIGDDHADLLYDEHPRKFNAPRKYYRGLRGLFNSVL